MSRTKQVSAWDLWEWVANHIAEEGRRYYQGDYVINDSYHLRNLGLEPPCGTAACRVGWFYLGMTGQIAPGPTLYLRVRSALKMTADQLQPLVSGGACMYASGLSPTYNESDASSRPQMSIVHAGSPEYVRRGVDGLRTWMRQHEAHLKATMVEVHADYPRLNLGTQPG